MSNLQNTINVLLKAGVGLYVAAAIMAALAVYLFIRYRLVDEIRYRVGHKKLPAGYLHYTGSLSGKKSRSNKHDIPSSNSRNHASYDPTMRTDDEIIEESISEEGPEDATGELPGGKENVSLKQNGVKWTVVEETSLLNDAGGKKGWLLKDSNKKDIQAEVNEDSWNETTGELKEAPDDDGSTPTDLLVGTVNGSESGRERA